MYKLLRVLPLLFLGWAVLACTEGVVPEFPVPDSSKRIDVNLQFTLSVSGVYGALTKAPNADINEGEYPLGTTAVENQMRTITVIVESLNDDGTSLTIPIYDYQTLYLPVGVTTYETIMKLNTTIGKKYIYIGANMRPEHIQAFIGDGVYKTTKTTAKGVTESVMTINEDATGQDILMFGQASSSEGKVIELTAASIDNPTQLGNIVLERVVTKVLLTCKTKENSDVDVVVRDFVSGYENEGFCELKDIYYMLNMTNKQMYIKRTQNESSAYIDPNYSLVDYLEYNPWNNVFLLKNREDYEKHFMHYDANDMMQISTSNRDFEPFSALETMKSNPLKYDANRVGENSNVSSHYTEGIYCMENLVSIPSLAVLMRSGKTLDDIADLVSTYMLIAVRYIPKNIYLDANDSQPTFYTSLDEAMAVLPSVIDGDITYPEGTYWMFNDGTTKGYYTYEAMKNSTLDKAMFQPFIGGYSYYTSFIDGKVDENGVISYGDNLSWGIERNHYYILNVQEIVAPGSSVMDNPMRINSVIIKDWTYKGSTEVPVKPT